MDERQQRLFAGLRAKILDRAGVGLVSAALGLHENTVRRRKVEMDDLPASPEKRIRKTGAGAKKVLAQPGLLCAFDAVLAGNTAGLPQDASVEERVNNIASAEWF